MIPIYNNRYDKYHILLYQCEYNIAMHVTLCFIKQNQTIELMAVNPNIRYGYRTSGVLSHLIRSSL